MSLFEKFGIDNFLHSQGREHGANGVANEGMIIDDQDPHLVEFDAAHSRVYWAPSLAPNAALRLGRRLWNSPTTPSTEFVGGDASAVP